MQSTAAANTIRVSALVRFDYDAFPADYDGQTDPSAIFDTDLETDSAFLMDTDMEVIEVTGGTAPGYAAGLSLLVENQALRDFTTDDQQDVQEERKYVEGAVDMLVKLTGVERDTIYADLAHELSARTGLGIEFLEGVLAL